MKLKTKNLIAALVLALLLTLCLSPSARAQLATPVLTLTDTQTLEDTTVTLTISLDTQNIAADPNIVSSVSISGIPPTWTVNPNGGLYDPATGVWSMALGAGATGYTGGPTLTPPLNSDVDLSGLTVLATNTDTVTGAVISSSGTVNIIVDAVAEPAVVSASDVSVGAGAVATLPITTGPADTDGSETLQNVVISGVPVDFVLSAGTYDAATNTWILAQTDLAGLTITPPSPPAFTGTVIVNVRITTIESNKTDTDFDLFNDQNNASTTFTVTWDNGPVPPPPPPPPPVPGAGSGASICASLAAPGNTRGVNTVASTDGANASNISIRDNAIRGRWIPTFLCMTHQFSLVMMDQVGAVGMFLDAKQQLETQRLFQQLQAEAHKDYQPSVQMCRIGTNVRSLARSENMSDTSAQLINSALMSRQTLSVNSSAGAGPHIDKANRLTQFKRMYCDPSDNNGILADICTPAGPAARRNKDISFTSTLETPLTLNFNMSVNALSADEEDIFALAKNLYANDVFTQVNEKYLVSEFSKDEFQDMRSVHAMRSVAFNSFSHLAGMRAAGTAQAGPFMNNILTDMGLTTVEATAFLGANPSYFAQMEVLTKKMFQSPAFFTNLYDKPENVQRIGVSVQALKLMQDRDRYESALRREMMISLLLELNLRKAQDKVSNRILDSVSTAFPR